MIERVGSFVTEGCLNSPADFLEPTVPSSMPTQSMKRWYLSRNWEIEQCEMQSLHSAVPILSVVVDDGQGAYLCASYISGNIYHNLGTSH